MLHNISFRAKVMIAPAIMAIFMLAFAGFVIQSMNGTFDAMNRMEQSALTRLSLIDQIVTDGQRLQARLYQATSFGLKGANDKIAKLDDEIRTIQKEFKKNVSKLRNMGLSGQQSRLLGQTKQPIGKFFKSSKTR